MRCNKYIVKPEEKMVIGTIRKFETKRVIDEIGDIYGLYSPLTLAVDAILPSNYSNDLFSKIKGVAKCQDCDEFSEKTGKNIVDIKVSYKYHDAMIRKYNYLERNLKKLLNKIYELKREHVAYKEMCDEKLKKYM